MSDSWRCPTVPPRPTALASTPGLPRRTRVEVGEQAFDDDDDHGDAPPPLEIGRVLEIARLGCMPERSAPPPERQRCEQQRHEGQ